MVRKFRPREEFISGLTMTLAFGALWIFIGGRFWIFPMVFAGLIPAIRGAVRFFSRRSIGQSAAKEIDEPKSSSIERTILTVAKSERGRVTPALVALNTDASMSEAEAALQELVKQGYAGMEVRDNGTVEYVFQEFLPRVGEDS